MTSTEKGETLRKYIIQKSEDAQSQVQQMRDNAEAEADIRNNGKPREPDMRSTEKRIILNCRSRSLTFQVEQVGIVIAGKKCKK